MIEVKDKFDQPIDIGSLVGVSTNSGMYVGRVTKFNIISTASGKQRLSTVQVLLTTGRKQSYDIPDRRMINLDSIHRVIDRIGI